MASHLDRAMVAFSLAVVGTVAIPTVFFPETSCLSSGPHLHFCAVGRVPTVLVLLTAVAGLPLATWLVGSDAE